MVTLEGVYAKIRRASEQLCALKSDITRFCEEQKLQIVREEWKDAGKLAWIFQGETPTVPIE